MMREDTHIVFSFISSLTDISKFTLIGGTAIAIKANHRISEDLDFCVTSNTLDRLAINNIIKELSVNFNVTNITDVTQQEVFENDGLDLFNYHQDWLVDNVKLTFFTAGSNDKERDLLSRQSCYKIDHVNVMSLEGLFITKCLVLCDRIKTRDIFDLWWLIKNSNHEIKEIFNVIQDTRPHITYESIRYRLLDWEMSKTDEGLESVVNISFDTVRQELRTLVDVMEIAMARDLTRIFKSDINAPKAKILT